MVATGMIDRVDHLVLTVADIEAATQFYERVLGFEREFFRDPDGNLVEVAEYPKG